MSLLAHVAKRALSVLFGGTDAAVEDGSELLQRARACVAAEDWSTARECYAQIVQQQPDNDGALYALGQVCMRLRAVDQAAACFAQVVADHPERVDALNALGNARRFQQRWAEAREQYQRALAMQPDFISALTNLGLCLKNEGRPEAGLQFLQRAMELGAREEAVELNYAAGLLDVGRFDDAERLLRECVARQPDLAEAHVALAIVLLGSGRFEDGWREYEWRMRLDEWEVQSPCESPVWRGEALAGKTLLVRGEQGLGDQIMFASCLPQLMSQAQSCVVECDARLVPMLKRSFPQAAVYAQGGQESRGWEGNDVRPDLQVQMGSLPYMLGRATGSFPQHTGYLFADPDKVSRWKRRLADIGPGLKVGISWRGGTAQTRRLSRSIPLQQWRPIFDIPGSTLVSLQYGDVAADMDEAAGALPKPLYQLPDAIESYDETAALVSALDLVISVQTAVVHMAGALGKPVWALIPAIAEWRYMRSGELMPWYPAARLFRQDSSASWDPVLARVALALQALACRPADQRG